MEIFYDDSKKALDLYLNWEGIIGYTQDIIDTYYDLFPYDREALDDFLTEEGIIGYTDDIIDILETGEAYLDNADEEDINNLKRRLSINESITKKEIKEALKDIFNEFYSTFYPEVDDDVFIAYDYDELDQWVDWLNNRGIPYEINSIEENEIYDEDGDLYDGAIACLTILDESLNESNIKRYSDSIPYEKRKYWYWTKHGIGPGMLPKDVNVLEVREGQNTKGTNGTFILLDAILNTNELDKYDIIELSPKEELIKESIYIDAIKFEKQLPYAMRFKEYQVTDDGILYWITQGLFNEYDLYKFRDALEDTNITKAFVTSRDVSSYNYDRDIDNKVGAIIDLNNNIVDYENYRAANSDYIDENLCEDKRNKWDNEQLDIELDDIEEYVNNAGVEELTMIPWSEMLKNFPNICIWFDKYYKNLWGENGKVDENAPSIEDAWLYMDDIEYKVFINYTKKRGAASIINLFSKYDPSLQKNIRKNDSEDIDEYSGNLAKIESDWKNLVANNKNLFSFPNGKSIYFNVDLKNNIISTNDVQIYIDEDDSLDGNLSRLYDAYVEKHPEYLNLNNKNIWR